MRTLFLTAWTVSTTSTTVWWQNVAHCRALLVTARATSRRRSLYARLKPGFAKLYSSEKSLHSSVNVSSYAALKLKQARYLINVISTAQSNFSLGEEERISAVVTQVKTGSLG